MIYRIFSDLASFRNLELNSGLNILLTQKSETATNKQTRNGAGKTSLIELIHFVLGANANQESIFRSDLLTPWYFGLDLELRGKRVEVSRSGQDSNRVIVKSGCTSNWPIQPRANKKTGVNWISNNDWKNVLGELMFDLGMVVNESHVRFKPSFRSLFSYFVRRQDAGGFASHCTHAYQQQLWDQHVSISYLLSLDWSISQDFQKLREQEKTIKQLKKSIKEGSLPGFSGSAASLRTRVTSAESKARRLKQQLDEFTVIDEYKTIEDEASFLTGEMNRLGNENTSDRQFLDQLNSALESERPPGKNRFEDLYSEAGIVLPNLVVQQIEDAVRFHHAVVENRKAHLRSEIERIQNQISERDQEKLKLDKRKSELLKILNSGGALEQYTLLQREYSRLQAEADSLKQQLDIVEKIESEQNRSEIERRQFMERLRQDFHERSSTLEEAIVLFEELSEALYEQERSGHLTIDSTSNGPTFEVHIDAERSRGITSMQVFCFDMMLAILASKRACSPGFLVHDSHLFDGVDERQVAKAIQIGAARSDEYGFQYLITMNSDAVPQDGFGTDFDVYKYVLPVELDDTVEGGLFGLRFD